MSLPSVALRHHSRPCYLVPGLESLLTFGTVLPCLHTMPPRTEVITNGAKGRQETLSVPG